MPLPNEEPLKRRLTERAEMMVAVEFLMGRGFAEDEIGLQLSRFYYIDVDELNDVLAALARQPAHQMTLKRVA